MRRDDFAGPVWQSPVAFLVVLFVMVALLILAADTIWQAKMAEEPEQITATLIATERGGRVNPRDPRLLVKLRDGQTSRVAVEMSIISDCRIGSPITLNRRGKHFSLPARPCDPDSKRKATVQKN